MKEVDRMISDFLALTEQKPRKVQPRLCSSCKDNHAPDFVCWARVGTVYDPGMRGWSK